MLAIVLAPGAAHEPITTKLTWTQEISRILNRHCLSCHREGGRAPMPLASYEEARPWAKAIRDEVLERRMPPWGAVKGVGEFRGDPSLSQPEIDMVVSWVEGGAPEGDPIYLPAPPHFEVEEPAPEGHEFVLESDAPHTFENGAAVLAIRPLGGASMEIRAYLPDGEVKDLLWLRQYKPEWNRTFVLRDALRLPAGTRLELYAPAPVAAAISVSKPGH